MAEHKQISRPQTFIPAGFYMLRAPVLPAKTFLDLAAAGHLSLETAPGEFEAAFQAQQESCYQHLEYLIAQPQITQALAVASSSLLEGLERLQRGEASPARRKRAYAGLLRYLTRMCTRPTPFGLFSGVALGSFATETHVCLASPPVERFRTRPDMSWLLSVLHRLEEDAALVSQLKVKLNQTAYLVGERAMLPFADTYGQQDNRAISLRATPVVRKVFELAQQFIPYTELCRAIQQTFPRATEEQIERLLWQLWEHHFLISQLHPPLTDACPTGYVRKQLDGLHGVDELKEKLDRVLEGTAALDRAGIGAPISMLFALVKAQEELSPVNKDKLPLQVDTALHLQSAALHQSLGEAAARAGEFLLRQTPLPTGSPHFQEYRLLFLEKYGEHAEVPLLDLLSAENGLDAPFTYEKPPRTYQRSSTLPQPDTSKRDSLLVSLVTEAVNARSLEVELTDDLQQRLERWSPNIGEAPISLEIYLQLHAHSCETIDRNEWTAVIGRNCGSPDAGRTFGRFFDLLGTPGMEALHNLATAEETLLPDVIFAELSYQPSHARLANVAIRPPLRSYEIAIGITPSVPPERVLSLNDLVVGVQHGRFYLRSLRLGKQVRVCQTHMLNTMLAPNVCRFINEIATDGLPILSSFNWGAAANAPFLPRLVITIAPSTRLVISPARWNLLAEKITPTGEGSTAVRWFQGLQEWRKQWRVPRYVYLTEADNRLLLDLEHPLMVSELYDELRKHDGTNQVSLEELLPDFEHLWLRDEQDAGYFAEIVVPLLRADAAIPAARQLVPEKKFTPPERVITPVERNRFPGEDWVYMKLYAAPGQHEEIIAGPLHEVVRTLQEQELIDRWFFIRYNDPEPHLRLRFHARDTTGSQPLLAAVLPWGLRQAQHGQIQRYMLDTYEREVERYGGPEAIDLLEQAFTIDSAIVSNIVAAQYAHRLTLDSLLIAVFTLDHFFTAWGCDVQQRLEWTHNASEKHAFSKEFHAERKHYGDLLSPRSQIDPMLAEQRSQLRELIHPQESYLSELGKQVRQLGIAGKLWLPEMSLLNSLAHMHINRLLGIDRTRENQIYAFWRHTLDALERRPEQEHTRK